MRKLQVEESISQWLKIVKVGGALVGQGMLERPNKVLVEECKIGQGWKVWQRSLFLFLLLRTNRQSHTRLIFVDQKVHFDSSMSLLSVFACDDSELTIVQVDVTHSVACQQIWQEKIT
ncbi:hypothetical protein Y032_0004g1769 [Ancylostoma ceylanicum]|uniref:Uncharacterized protein n=1 Tax=Ancylostoma ceylanicum TaxID=53326 RepID=A0A016VT60_9BILA|nr:hypothetical protein Y032_0004g1769 [Ancylostoma ceylanicum]